MSKKVDEQVKSDREIQRIKEKLSNSEKKYKKLLKTVELVEKERDAAACIKEATSSFTIEPHHSSRISEATAVLVASDWHVEEIVKKEAVNGLNEYSLSIAKERGTKFFSHGSRLIHIMGKDIKITKIVLALLGDFITNDIHDEMPESNQLAPTEAVIFAKEIIISGIKFLLKEHPGVEIECVCHSGNHARTTPKCHGQFEHGHSLEYLMYNSLSEDFQDKKNVNFIIPSSYHSYANIYGLTVRFHHGHAIRYWGGVGGITIPVNKAIKQWNDSKHADLDVFGHFHQYLDGGRFVANGSMIGYNAYAIRVKASYERPQQAFFLIDKKRGKTVSAPVLFI
jgi:hypothetical protein